MRGLVAKGVRREMRRAAGGAVIGTLQAMDAALSQHAEAIKTHTQADGEHISRIEAIERRLAVLEQHDWWGRLRQLWKGAK